MNRNWSNSREQYSSRNSPYRLRTSEFQQRARCLFADRASWSGGSNRRISEGDGLWELEPVSVPCLIPCHPCYTVWQTWCAKQGGVFSASSAEESVREDMELIKQDPYLPKALQVMGFVYDVFSGETREVV